MRLHVLSLPHTQTTAEYLTCAYTQKVVKFSRMMTRRGHDVVLYSGEQNEAECSEHVQLVSEEERAGWFGSGFDTVLTPLLWDANQPYWRLFNARAVAALLERIDMQKDILCLVTGWPMKPVTDALGIDTGVRPMIACEWAVGYEGVFTEFCAFESSAWMHHVYGMREWRNGRFYDTVIPNFFDPDDFHLAEKEDYLLFMGRMVGRKGVEIAAKIAKRAGMKLVLAGPGGVAEEGKVVAPEFTIEGDVEYVGEVGVEERARLMAGARALLCPTLYVEPFGGVCVEAMLSGTPVLTTDFGAFRETVTPEVGGRFSTLAEADHELELLLNGDMTPPAEIREIAIRRYSLDSVAPEFERWFGQLLGLWGVGFEA
jgi:glycosyltransferase involved in cell wall biosynthesis